MTTTYRGLVMTPIQRKSAQVLLGRTRLPFTLSAYSSEEGERIVRVAIFRHGKWEDIHIDPRGKVVKKPSNA